MGAASGGDGASAGGTGAAGGEGTVPGGIGAAPGGVGGLPGGRVTLAFIGESSADPRYRVPCGETPPLTLDDMSVLAGSEHTAYAPTR